MGQWFARLLKKEGHDVVISGRDQAKLKEAGRGLGVSTAANITAVKDAAAVLLSVTIECFSDVVQEIGPHISPGQIVLDITSIKESPVAAMHRYLKTPRVLGTHPLFGPGAESLENQNFVLTPTSATERELANKVAGYLEERKARVTVMTPREHDDLMGIILGLSHFIAIVAADTLLDSGVLQQTKAVGSPTYRVLLALIESVLAEDPELYGTLQMNLPGAAVIEKAFSEKARVWTGMVEGKQRREFVRQMKDLQNRLKKFLVIIMKL